MSTLFISDETLNCPETYYGGRKVPRIARSGSSERLSSDPWTGEWRGGQYDFRYIDSDFFLRRNKAKALNRTNPLTVRMISRDARAQLLDWWTVWVGPVVDIQPAENLCWDVRLGDIIHARLLSDQAQVPFRMIRDGFLSQLDEIHPGLDLDQPEPQIYGRHIRVPGIDPASPHGFVYTPPLLGTITWVADQYYVWLIAGHACAAVEAIRIDTALTEEGGDWLIPGQPNYTAVFGPTTYHDFESDTFPGQIRRYTLLFGKVGNPVPDAVAAGSKSLAVAVSGIETNGDGTGTVLDDRFDAYQDWFINNVAHQGINSYMSGPRLSNPTWSIYGAEVPILDTASVAACKAIAIERLPDNDGYKVAVIIGARPGDQVSLAALLADWHRSMGVRGGPTHRGRWRIGLLHPTAAAKAAAPLYDDVRHILKGSFATSFAHDEQADLIAFRADYEHLSGQWQTNGVIPVGATGPIPSERREYPMAPGIAQSNHLAVLEYRQRALAPQVVVLEGTIGPHPVTGDSMAYRELFDYIRYRHYAAVGGERQIRLGWVIGHRVLTGKRRVQLAVLDCEDLIGFDEFLGGVGGGEGGGGEGGGEGEGGVVAGGTEAPVESGTIYYVSLSGSDGNAGTSEEAPKRHISAALAVMAPGDTLYIREGTYTDALDVIDSALYDVPSGTSWDHYVLIAPYPDETVVLQPPSNTHAVRFTNADAYIVVRDLAVDYTNDASSDGREGIYVSGGSHHIRFRRVTVHDCKNFGVVFAKGAGGFCEFISGHVYNCGRGATGTDNTKGHGFYLSCGDNLCEGNYVHDNDGYGFHLFDNDGAKIVSRNVIRANRIQGNGLGHSVGYGVLACWGDNNRIYNNLILGNKGGVQIYVESQNDSVYHNTIVGNGDEGVALQYYRSGPTVRNNIVFGNGAGVVNYGGLAGTPIVDTNPTSDPLFVGGGDYHLTGDSPCRNAASPVGVPSVDFAGVARPQGTAADVGAYEYVEVT